MKKKLTYMLQNIKSLELLHTYQEITLPMARKQPLSTIKQCPHLQIYYCDNVMYPSKFWQQHPLWISQALRKTSCCFPSKDFSKSSNGYQNIWNVQQLNTELKMVTDPTPSDCNALLNSLNFFRIPSNRATSKTSIPLCKWKWSNK